MTSDLSRALRIAAAVISATCVVPERLTVTEWADKYRILPRSSTAPGPFRSSVAPYTRRPMDLGADPTVQRMVLCWGSQTLKSTVIENIIGHKIDLAPGPIIFVRPTQPDAEMWSKERFRTMVRVTPRLAERVMLHRSSESTTRFMKFKGDVGFLFAASSQSASELATWSTELAIGDEVDRMPDLPGEGPPMLVIELRTGAAEVFKIIHASTPGDADTTVIWPGLQAGTIEKYFMPCPKCSEVQPFLWRRPDEKGKDQFCLQYPVGKPHEAVYVCSNGCAIEPKWKDQMLRDGVWRATNPEGTYYSSHLTALYSPFAGTSWARIAEEWDRAQGKPEPLRVFINTRLAEPFSDIDAGMLKPDDLLNRREQWGDSVEDRVVPDGVGVLTIGVDVQANRIEARVWGWGVGLESWLIDAIVIPGDVSREVDTPDSIWNMVTSQLARSYRHVSGQDVPIRAGLMDSGYASTQVYRYCDPRRKKPVRLFFACKGDDGDRPLIGKPSVQGSRRVPLYIVGTDAYKKEFLRSQIYETAAGPGCVHWPMWASEEELLGHTSEEQKRVQRRGAKGIETKRLWVRKKYDGDKGVIPNEPLDCRGYARGAYELIPGIDKKIGEWAAAYSVVIPAGIDPTTPAPSRPAARARRPGGWMSGYR